MKKIILKSSAGFSLIEILIVFSIITLITGASWEIYRSTRSTNTFLTNNLNAQSEVRKAFKKMSAGIRSASPSSAGAYPIEAASSTAFVYYSDINRDGLKERIRYFFSGNILKEGVLIPNGSPATYNPANEKVSNLAINIVRTASSSFTYYDGNYDGTNSALAFPVNILNIRLVKISLVVDDDPAKSPKAMNFTTQISIRNLKDNQ